MNTNNLDGYELIEDVVRNSFAGIVWTHKIHEKQADIYNKTYKCLETVNIIAASITAAGIIGMFGADLLAVKILSLATSLVSLFVTAYFKSFDLKDLISLHKVTANKLVSLRNSYILLLTDIRFQDDNVENFRARYDKLVDEATAILAEAPITTDKAVALASDALKVKRDNTYTDVEIDSFLPLVLRKGDKNG